MILAQNATRLEARCVIIVEGQDDARFFDSLTSSRTHRQAEITFVDAKGKDKIGSVLKNIINMRGFRDVAALAVMRDADEAPQAAFASLQGHFRNALQNEPSMPNCWHSRPNSVSIAAILVPADGPGALETLIAQCIPIQWREAAGHFIDEIDHLEEPYLSNFSGAELAKREIYTLAAVGRRNPTKIQPGLRIGESASAGVWDLQHPVFDQYVQLLNSWYA